ncbi:MAG: 7-carboxy-7-deazaguanine synthase QueE [Pirellulales bacterium]
MLIAEVYESLQGEGRLAGTPSVFLRTSGCNLRCRWCDTPFTSWEPTGEQRTIDFLCEKVTAFGLRHVVVTGGEPLVAAGIDELCGRFRAAGQHVTIETAGTVLPPAGPPPADLLSLSPKLASSTPISASGGWPRRHEAARRSDKTLVTLMASAPFQLKFVIDTETDLDEAVTWLADLGIKAGSPAGRHVYLMPQGTDANNLAATETWLGPACDRLGFQLCRRHHIDWFGNQRGS